jgi:hypothetical protein
MKATCDDCVYEGDCFPVLKFMNSHSSNPFCKQSRAKAVRKVKVNDAPARSNNTVEKV